MHRCPNVWYVARLLPPANKVAGETWVPTPSSPPLDIGPGYLSPCPYLEMGPGYRSSQTWDWVPTPRHEHGYLPLPDMAPVYLPLPLT